MLKNAALALGGLGALLILWTTVCRFTATQTVALFGQQFKPGTLILLANTCFLVGIFLLLLNSPRRGG